MARKSIHIPTSISLQLENLQKVSQQLDVLRKDSTKNFSAGLNEELESFLENIERITTERSGDLTKGKMSSEELQEFAKELAKMADSAESVVGKISKAFEKIKIEDFTPEFKDKLEDLSNKVQQENNKMIQAQADLDLAHERSGTTFVGFAELKIHNLKNMSAVVGKLEKDEQRYAELTQKAEEDAKSLTKAERDRLAVLEEFREVRKTALEQAKAYVAEEDQLKLQIKTSKEAIAQYKNEIKLTTEAAQEHVKISIAEHLQSIQTNVDEARKKTNLFAEELKQSTGSLNVFRNIMTNTRESLLMFITGIVSGRLVISLLNKMFKETITVIKDLDKSFNEMAMVTTMTTKESWQLHKALSAIASSTGHTVTEIADLSVQFFRQGRSISETIKLTEAAAAAAKVAGISVGDSVNYLTSAVNSYHLSASQAMVVSDKFAALAANSASSYEELAKALSKVAAQAYTVGVDMDNLMGFIAKGLEVTREAPENIGTAFKTIFARMAELKDIGKTMEDGMSIGRVDTALRAVGVRLTDTAGEIRNLDEVLIELGHKWDSLSKNQKAYVAVALAGTRQQARLLAVMEDFGRTMELSDISVNSFGATLAQQDKYTNSMAFALNTITVAWQDFITSLGSAEIFTTILKHVAGLLEGTNILIETFGGLPKVIAMVIAGVLMYKAAMWSASLANNAATISNIKLAITEGTLTAEYLKQSIALMGTTTKTIALTAAKTALNAVLNPTTILIGLAVAALGAMAYAFVKAQKKNKDFVEGIKKTQAEIYNLNRKSKDLQSLVDQYEKIDRKIIKTNEDLETQQELLEQIQDISDIAPMAGKLDTTSVNQAILELDKKANDMMNESIKKAVKSYGALSEAYQAALLENDPVSQQHIIIGQALEMSGKSYTEYLKMAAKEQRLLLVQAEMLVKYTQKPMEYKVVYTGVMNTQFTELFDTYEAAREFAKEKDVEVGVVSVEDEALFKAAEEAQKFFEILHSQNFEDLGLDEQLVLMQGFGELSEETRKILIEMIPGIQSVTTAMEVLGLTSEREFLNIMQQTELSTDYFIKLAEHIQQGDYIPSDLKQSFLVDVLNNADQAISRLRRSMIEGGYSTLDYLKALDQLTNLIDSKTIQDLDGLSKGLNSVYDNMEKLNQALTGQGELELSFLMEMLELYPQLYDIMETGQEITLEQMEEIAKKKKDDLIEELKDKKTLLEAELEIIDSQMQWWEAALAGRRALENITAKEKVKLEKLAQEDITKAAEYSYKLMAKYKVEINKKALVDMLRMEKKMLGSPEEKRLIDERMSALQSTATPGMPTQSKTSGLDDSSQYERLVQEQIDLLAARRIGVSNEIKAIETAMSAIEKYGNLQGKSAKNTRDAAKATKEYEARITELYIALQKLATIEGELATLDVRRKYTEDGQEFVAITKAMNLGLLEKNKAVERVIEVEKSMQDTMLKSLGSIGSVVEIIAGKALPKISEYNKLSNEQKKSIDDVVIEYNNLTDSITENTNALRENNAQIEANVQLLLDMTINMHNAIDEALKNKSKKELDILKKQIAEEKKLLDKRKKMYQDSFAEEDYHDELNEIDQRRSEIIMELAQLEGATDANSMKRRKTLLEEKEKLDKEYNEKVRDYNRDAILDMLEDEKEALEEKEKAAEETHNDYINDAKRRQEDVDEILKGSTEKILEFLMEHGTAFNNKLVLETMKLASQTKTEIDVVKNAGIEAGDTMDDIRTKVLELPDEWILKYDLPDFLKIASDIDRVNDAYKQLPKESSQKPASSGSGSGSGRGSTVTTVPFPSQGHMDGDQFVVDFDNKKKTTPATPKGSSIPMVFTTGGEADYTGPAWVDGTKRAPERVLSPVQTELFNRMVQGLEMQNARGGISQDFAVGPINVNLASGSPAEAREAANIIYKEFRELIKDKGINTNKKVTAF